MLIIDQYNEYYNELKSQFTFKTFFENGRKIKRYRLNEEELFYLTLKYNVYYGFWDFHSDIEMEIKYVNN